VERDLGVRLAVLEERVAAMSKLVLEHDLAVDELVRSRSIADAIAREATKRYGTWLAAGGLVLTAVNVAAGIWFGAS